MVLHTCQFFPFLRVYMILAFFLRNIKLLIFGNTKRPTTAVIGKYVIYHLKMNIQALPLADSKPHSTAVSD